MCLGIPCIRYPQTITIEKTKRRVAEVQSASPEISRVTFSCNVPFLIEIGAFVVRTTDINGKLVQFAWWLLATVAFTLVVTIRIDLFGSSLERNEGEYAYAGKLILQDITRYERVRQSVNSRRFVATIKSHLFVGKHSETVETVKNYILIDRRSRFALPKV
jgi:hypothetical protein